MNSQQAVADIEYDVVATADQLTYQFYTQPRKSFTVEWGDGTTSTVPTEASTQSHTYAAAGTYTIKVQDTTGLFDGSRYMKPGAGSSSTDATVIACAAMVAEVRSWNTRATVIWQYCFDRCVNMTGMEVPAGTTLINNYAFRSCSKWHPSALPSSVTRIKEGCFRDCVLIDWTSVPTGLGTNIEANTFRGCTALALTAIPNALTSIGTNAFYECSNITFTSLPSSLTTVGQSAFEKCSKLALTSFPTGITSIGGSAFKQCPLITATALPPNLTTIASGAFYGCTNLALTSLPSGITSIEATAFRECTHLAFTALPTGVTTLGTSAFYLAKNNALTTITGTGATINGTAFSSCWRPSSQTGYDGQPHSITFLGVPTSIAATAFSTNEMLTDIYVPWSQGDVANAPWGAPNATVHYNTSNTPATINLTITHPYIGTSTYTESKSSVQYNGKDWWCSDSTATDPEDPMIRMSATSLVWYNSAWCVMWQQDGTGTPYSMGSDAGTGDAPAEGTYSVSFGMFGTCTIQIAYGT